MDTWFLDIAEGEFDDLDGQQVRIKPEAIDTLCQLTKFTKRELQLMYRGFKQVSASNLPRKNLSNWTRIGF